MGGLLGKPKAPPPPKPPTPMPTMDDEAIALAKKKNLQMQAARSGRESTMLSSDQGGTLGGGG